MYSVDKLIFNAAIYIILLLNNFFFIYFKIYVIVSHVCYYFRSHKLRIHIIMALNFSLVNIKKKN